MKKPSLLKIIICVMCMVLALSVFAACTKTDEEAYIPETTEAPTEPITEAIPAEINPLTGLAGLSESAQGKRPVAVVVENSPDARPQWGLCSPDIVMEGLVEGGITRMLFVYQDIATAPKIGPNRSARHNYIEFACGLDAIYVHFGGSYAAYNLLAADSTIDHLDGSKADGSAFKRDTSRRVASEHTAYTTGEWLSAKIADKGIRTDIAQGYERPFSFAKEKRTLANPCNSIELTFSSSYRHTFKYNADDGLYYNYMNTSPMNEADGNQMAVSNVIALYCNVTKYNNDAKLVEWHLTEGKGVYASNGTYEEITWKKGGTHDMLKLYDANGNELQLNTGKSWIGFVPAANPANISSEQA